VTGDREVDIAVFGATGFVGRLVAGYLAGHAPAGVRIGLAGRSAQRLAALAAQLGPAAAAWPLLVAEGAVDVSAEPEVSLWDIAALQVIVEEAGGRFTDIDGNRTPDGGSIVCTNGRLHDEVLTKIKAP